MKKQPRKIKEFLIYFNNAEEFASVLGKTSYYRTMQNQISALMKSFSPSYVIEFGAGSGNTASRIAKENKTLSLVAVDNREQLMEYCQNDKDLKSIANLTFVKGDLTKLESFNFINVDVVLMVYSFNYINDPLKVKEEFLTNLHSKMKKGARLMIGDWFLHDEKPYDKEALTELYLSRVEEGAQSIFWNELNGEHTKEEQEQAQEKLQEYKDSQKELLDHILNREQLYPVSKKWLLNTATKIGFTVELQEDINNINDAVIVLKK